MSAFESARLVEARGMAILSPFLLEKADGRIVVLEKGPLARALQETVGDVILQMPSGRAWSVEIKVEEDDKYGNFFLETWSNKNLEDRNNAVAVGSNVGWLFKVRSDLLFYYFLLSDKMYVFDLFKLKRWAFGSNKDAARLYDFEEKAQSKRSQLNDTWGRCVPISILAREVGYRLIFPRQLPLPGMEESIADGYDAADDMRRSVNECLSEVRTRMANGGLKWPAE